MGSDLTANFDEQRKEVTGETLEQMRQNYFIMAHMRGSDEASIGGLSVNTSGRHDAASIEKKKKQQATNDMLLIAMLDDMRERLEGLEAQMARQLELLRGKYGDDVIDGMAETFLNDDELAGLKTDEQRCRALTEKFLDENGDIKEKYKDLNEAKYIRDWSKAQALKLEIAQYEGRNDLTHIEAREVQNSAKQDSLSENKNKITQSNNDELKNVVDREIDNSAAETNRFKTTNTLGFS